MIALLLATSANLSFTMPCAKGCNDSVGPETGLAYVIFQRRLPGESARRDWYTFPAGGMECQRVTWSVPIQGPTYWSVLTIDSAGNRSCPGNEVLTAPVVSVPPAVPPIELERWYDISGRRLERKPSVPGVYFRRVPGQRTARVVVLR